MEEHVPENLQASIERAVSDHVSGRLTSIEHVGKLWYATLAGAVLLGAWVTGIQMGQNQMAVQIGKIETAQAQAQTQQLKDAERWGQVQSDIATVKGDIADIKDSVKK